MASVPPVPSAEPRLIASPAPPGGNGDSFLEFLEPSRPNAPADAGARERAAAPSRKGPQPASAGERKAAPPPDRSATNRRIDSEGGTKPDAGAPCAECAEAEEVAGAAEKTEGGEETTVVVEAMFDATADAAEPPVAAETGGVPAETAVEPGSANGDAILPAAAGIPAAAAEADADAGAQPGPAPANERVAAQAAQPAVPSPAGPAPEAMAAPVSAVAVRAATRSEAGPAVPALPEAASRPANAAPATPFAPQSAVSPDGAAAEPGSSTSTADQNARVPAATARPDASEPPDAPEPGDARPREFAAQLRETLALRPAAAPEPSAEGPLRLSANPAPATAPAATPAAEPLRAAAATLNPASLHAATVREPNPVPLTGTALAIEIVSRLRDGLRRFEVRLDPPELGRVDVRLEVDRAGHATTRLTVDRPETLDLLQREARGLERALQQAGLKTDAGGLEFSLRSHGQEGDGEPPARHGGEERRDALVAEDPDNAAGLARYRLAALARGGIDIRI